MTDNTTTFIVNNDGVIRISLSITKRDTCPTVPFFTIYRQDYYYYHRHQQQQFSWERWNVMEHTVFSSASLATAKVCVPYANLGYESDLILWVRATDRYVMEVAGTSSRQQTRERDYNTINRCCTAGRQLGRSQLYSSYENRRCRNVLTELPRSPK